MHLDRMRIRAVAGAMLLVAPAVARAASDADVARLQNELAATRAELQSTREALEGLARKVDRMEAARGSGAAAESAAPRLPPVNADNPAISFVVDSTFSHDTEAQGAQFDLRSGELFLSAPIDPFLRGYAAIVGSSEEGIDIEEAALVTTSLPWNLTVKGGRFFADVGRLPHWHEEQLPFANRPPSIDRIIGGESGAEGVEVAWLAPIDHYLRLTTGVYNAIGNERREELAEEGFLGGKRGFGELTWLARPTTYFDLTDALNLELGGSFAFVPNGESRRRLYGVDATLRHQPGTSRFYQGLVFGTEWYWNDERFLGDDFAGDRSFDRNGGYGYVEAFFGRRYSFGVRADWSEDIAGDPDRLQTYSAFATWMPSEFHRLRLQFDHQNWDERENNEVFTLQWTAFLGSHAHGFATR